MRIEFTESDLHDTTTRAALLALLQSANEATPVKTVTVKLDADEVTKAEQAMPGSTTPAEPAHCETTGRPTSEFATVHGEITSELNNESDDTPPLTDSAGHLWDARIHVESRNRLKDGTWRLKRGITQEEADAVLAEQHPKPGPVEPDPAAVGFGAPPAAAPVAPPVPAEPQHTFNDFMSFVMAQISAKKITSPQLLEIVKAHGLENIPAAMQHPDKIGPIMKQIQETYP